MRVKSVRKRLSEIIPGIEITNTVGDQETLIQGMVMDSRQVQPGDLYACVPGMNVDGHDFAVQAIAKGAVALLVERILPLDIPQLQVNNVREVMGYLAANLYDHPAGKLEVVGVTGTNGKTTITHLVEHIAAREGKKVGLIGTLGARIAGRELPGSRTTPEAIDLQKLLREMVDEGVQYAVMEVSSHALVLGRVKGCEFDAGIFSNLTQDHLDYHKTMEEYLQAKAILFSGLTGAKEPKVGVINGDDPAGSTLIRLSAAPVVTYGVKAEHLDYRAEDIQLTADGVKFTVRFKGQSVQVEYSTPGMFSVYNALAAFAWGVESGRSPQQVREALASVLGVPGRFESVRMGQPFQVIVDYAHTPDGLENVCKTAQEFTQGRLITVFGCGGDRDKGKRPQMGAIAEELSDHVIVTSDNPRTEDPRQIIRDILEGIEGIDYTANVNRREAIECACLLAKEGDTVLIAGKGHEDYQIIGKDVFPFDDREVAREALRRLGYVG
ncbi:UDP-N-acetylmuramoyl-L-alanyl-D-glutamate--2,6-diaminopimelate ligase [Desulfitobacterium sp. PCE1]|uniref:UDP-N-acetylmuramoyl-L-alanyl-D-glutamate--2, 6-diaminopimelate ligase n=1 Tax=Desulfitobacterium sp. PCE1 TaxID=146907 RepID=UPI00039BF988|nr:UDP-N-acetylmuramoyl-L-alanyl-D-glutamate--2,6-diaminopimelate ligase [Desulfitobacterium sp. PCE1]